MNEYARLATGKHPAGRSYPELIASAFGTDEKLSKIHGESLEIAQTFTDCLTYLEKARLGRATARAFAVLALELHDRKNSGAIVKEGLAVITSMNDIVSQCVDIRNKKKEHLMAFFLNARHQLICKEIISIGTLTASLAHPREIFAPAIGKAAAAVILCHNHPSGDPTPSEEDVRLTKRIAQAGMIMGIDLLDHLIVSDNGCYSFKTAGQL